MGVNIDVINFNDALARIEQFIESRDLHYVCVNSTQDVMISQDNPEFREIVNRADLATADGWPVVWAIRANGFQQEGRVTGPDLMLALCERSAKKGYTHFFYGGAEGVPELLEAKLKDKFPGMRVKGKFSPPFRLLSEEEDQAIIKMLNDSGTDVLWVGLGTPKQHFWIKEHFGKIKIPVMIGVGAAFDFHSGRIKRAPLWMQSWYLEWLYRLCQEPKRLWKRYFNYLPRFAFHFLCQITKVKLSNIHLMNPFKRSNV
jgi:N-acetylglucosaminyldiphosphoundecaprenol N-acetyl-beta-D-mannosaminyltransferase